MLEESLDARVSIYQVQKTVLHRILYVDPRPRLLTEFLPKTLVSGELLLFIGPRVSRVSVARSLDHHDRMTKKKKKENRKISHHHKDYAKILQDCAV